MERTHVVAKHAQVARFDLPGVRVGLCPPFWNFSAGFVACSDYVSQSIRTTSKCFILEYIRDAKASPPTMMEILLCPEAILRAASSHSSPG